MTTLTWQTERVLKISAQERDSTTPVDNPHLQLTKVYIYTSTNYIYYAPPVRKGAISVAFVRPSVCLSVCPPIAYIANNSRTRRPSVPNFEMKVPRLGCDSHTSFKVKRSKIKVTRPINADTHRAPYLPNAKAYELQTW